MSTDADQNFIIYFRATCSQVKDTLLDCPLSPPGTRPIICVDECQVWNRLNKSNIWNVLHLQAFKINVFSLAQWPLIQVLLLVSDTCWSAGIASEETFWGGKGWGHKVFLKSHSDLFFIERLSHCISKRFCAPSLLNHCFFMSESSRSMKSQCNITSKAVAPRVKWRSRFKRAPSGLGENAFQHRWKFTIYIIFYVPNASLAQNSSSSGQRKPCKYYVKNAEKGNFKLIF